jgi:protease-4
MLSRVKRAWTWAVDSYVLFVVLGIALGALLVPPAVGVATGSDGTVAVVHIDGSISGAQASEYAAAMTTARQQADAVVIVANSGGGSAPASEEMYMQTVRTSEEMPVVAAVDGAAASGAYYAIAPADEIFVKPASSVGSVGVLAQTPPQVEPNDLIATTGPDKLGGGEREFRHDLATIQAAFLAAVYDHRGDRLEMDRAELGAAATYTGLDAVERGVVDDVGDRQEAIDVAASEAGIDRPEVIVLRSERASGTFLMRSTYLASEASDREMVDRAVLRAGDGEAGPPAYLMVPRAVLGTDTRVVSGAEAAAAEGRLGDGAAGASAGGNASATDATPDGVGDGSTPATGGAA